MELSFYKHVKERVCFIMGRWRVCLNVKGKLKDAGKNCKIKIYVICTYGRILLHRPNGKRKLCVGETVSVYKLLSEI